MQPSQLSRYMKDPRAMGPETIPELMSLVEQFPYFQPAHMLLSFAAKRYDAAVYQRTLKKTAIVVSNRARLFELILDAERDQSSPVPAEAPAGAKPEHDLTLLKVAEQASDEPLMQEPTPSAEKSEPAKETGPPATPDLTESVEKEIGRQVVAARVEKEIRHIPTAEGPAPAEPSQPPASFGDWLSYLKKNNGQPYEEIEREVKKDKIKQEPPPSGQSQVPSERREKNRAIIDSVIEKNPGHIRVREEKFFTAGTKAKESLLDNEHLVTETLARIYALQGNMAKAIRAYQILSLKNPQKSAYFAGLIKKLRNNEKPE